MIANTHQIEMRPISSLKPYAGNARTHSKKQIKQIASSIQRFGFTNPVLVSNDDEIIAGHGRVIAAKEIGLSTVPTLKLSYLSPAERRAYVLADNKLALNAGWDNEILAIELQALIDIDFDVTLTGFSLAETDIILDLAGDRSIDRISRAGGCCSCAPDWARIPSRRFMVARPSSSIVRGRSEPDRLWPPSRERACGFGFYRPALQRSHRRPCVRPGNRAPS